MAMTSGRMLAVGRVRARGVLAAVSAVVAALAVAATGIGWYFADVATAVDHATSYPLTVLAVSEAERGAGARTVTLSRSDDAVRPATFGLDFPGGHGIVEAPTKSTPNAATRPLALVTGRALRAGMHVALDTDIVTGDPASADRLAFTDVTVPTPVGPAPAWLVPGTGSAARTWVVAVHGHNASRTETLRVLPALHATGASVLAITYRNDVGAPRSPDGRDHLGATEWHDVDSAVGYALGHGATRVVLYGWSMGGGMVLTEARMGQHRGAVVGLVLDAPALDWRSILDHQGGNRGLPLLETRVAEEVISWRIGFDFADVDQVAHAHDLTVPVLLIVGTGDDYVPTGPAYALARARPRLVHLLAVPDAGHTEAFNVDPAAYDTAVTGFLTALPGR